MNELPIAKANCRPTARTRLAKRLLSLWAIVTITACAHRPPTTPAAVETLPEIHVKVTSITSGEPAIDAYTAQTLFERATAAANRGDCEAAVTLYQKLNTEFSTSELAEPALYNEGLCLNQLNRFADAAAVYQQMAARFPDSKDLKYILFQLSAAQEELEAWPDMIASLDTLLQKPDLLSPLDQVEIHAKKGAALMETDSPGLARIELEQAIHIFTRNAEISPTAPDFHYSMAQFKLAELLHAEMRQVTLPADDTTLEAMLEKKCQLLLDSQHLYTQVIRIGHPHWSAAAAYRTGALYHHLWQDILAAPAPAGLTEEERQVYQEILHRRIKVLLQKAVTQWKRTIKFAMRLQLDNAWVAQTQTDLQEIENLLEIEEKVGADLPIE